MTQYIETKTRDGATLRIEVEDINRPTPGFTRSSTSTNVSSEALDDAYDQLLSTIKGCAAGVVETIEGLEPSPSAAAIDFAIKIDAEAGTMIARSREDAQFRISLNWKQETPKDEDAE